MRRHAGSGGASVGIVTPPAPHGSYKRVWVLVLWPEVGAEAIDGGDGLHALLRGKRFNRGMVTELRGPGRPFCGSGVCAVASLEARQQAFRSRQPVWVQVVDQVVERFPCSHR